jgi:hypothetical protein
MRARHTWLGGGKSEVGTTTVGVFPGEDTLIRARVRENL